MFYVRRYKAGEEESLRQICRDTTLHVNVKDYGVELVNKWAARLADAPRWAERVHRHNPFVAVMDNQIVGFAEITDAGKISAFYSHWQWQRKGVGDALYDAIEAEAARLNLDHLLVESSTGASGFFERKGFRVVGENETLTDGVPSRSVLLRKRLKRHR